MVSFSPSIERNPPKTAARTDSPSVGSMRTMPASTSWAISGSCRGRMPISPTAVLAKTNSAVPDQTLRSTATSSTCISATRRHPLLSLGVARTARPGVVRPAARAGSLVVLLLVLLDVVEVTAHLEGLLGVVVVFALRDLVERLDRVLDVDVRARLAGELLGRVHVLAEEALDAPRSGDGELVLLGELVDAEDGDDVLQVVVLLQDPDDLAGDAVVLVAHVLRRQDRRGRRQRVHRREDALREHVAGELRGRVEVGEGGGRRRVGVVVGGHVDRLHRGDRPALGRRDPLLQLT